MTLPNVANALGWTLLHSLWEGTAIALLLIAVLSLTQSSQGRYLASCLALLALLLAFFCTAVLELPQSIPGSLAVKLTSRTSADGGSPSMLPAQGNMAQLLPYLGWLWMAGVLLFHFRSLAAWVGSRRLRRHGVCLAPEFWQRRLVDLLSILRMRQPVALLESCFAHLPQAVGFLRPAILVPVGMLASMPAGQVEAILLHELAHIQRKDYLVNLLQNIAENFLFYHPAAWWISRSLRNEREHCCDDLVLAARGNAVEYATALTALETNRQTVNRTVLASNGGNLMNRIARILNPGENRPTAIGPLFLMGILTLIAAVTLSAWQRAPATQRIIPAQAWLDLDVAYLITPAERAAFLSLTTEEERDHFIEQFWLRRDPTPGTEQNEAKEEHYRRIGYANEKYSTKITSGWKTDRGRIYIQFGPPDELESHPSGSSTLAAPYEDWLYHKLDGIGTHVKMQFVDQTGNGDYRMTRDPNPPFAFIPRVTDKVIMFSFYLLTLI